MNERKKPVRALFILSPLIFCLFLRLGLGNANNAKLINFSEIKNQFQTRFKIFSLEMFPACLPCVS